VPAEALLSLSRLKMPLDAAINHRAASVSRWTARANPVG
jgi:hypothetical protein